MEELLLARHADPANTVLIADLTVGGERVSSNLLYFYAPKDLQLTPQVINSSLSPNGMYIAFSYRPSLLLLAFTFLSAI